MTSKSTKNSKAKKATRRAVGLKRMVKRISKQDMSAIQKISKNVAEALIG
jgi:hypothetical protein